MIDSILQNQTQKVKLTSPPLFDLGACVATPAAIDLMEKHSFDPMHLIARHVCGDWGDVHPEEAQNNVSAIETGYRIMSVYRLVPSDVIEATDIENRHTLPTVWLITDPEDDNDKRPATTILTPSDY